MSGGRSAPSWTRRVVGAGLAYCTWNALASAYTYRTIGAAANRIVEEDGPGASVEVVLHVRSGSLSAEQTASDGSKTSVRVLPHLILTDLLSGRRSEWYVMCRKRQGRTEWHSSATPPSGASPGGGDGEPPAPWESAVQDT